MGTHCAYYEIHRDKHTRYERTLDGYNICRQVETWATGTVEIDPHNMGDGVLQINKDCEHEQEYFVLIDYDEKVIGLSFSVPFRVRNVLRGQGWELCQMSDECDYEGAIDTSRLD